MWFVYNSSRGNCYLDFGHVVCCGNLLNFVRDLVGFCCLGIGGFVWAVYIEILNQNTFLYG